MSSLLLFFDLLCVFVSWPVLPKLVDMYFFITTRAEHRNLLMVHQLVLMLLIWTLLLYLRFMKSLGTHLLNFLFREHLEVFKLEEPRDD